MTTLDDLLALLPDNTNGQIGADDLRAIVTSLWEHAWVGNQYPMDWTTASTGLPSSGRVNVTPWDGTATVLHVSKTDGAGVNIPVQVAGVVGLETPGSRVRVRTADLASELHATTTGSVTDQGNYWDIGISGVIVGGTVPANNEDVTLTVLIEVLP